LIVNVALAGQGTTRFVLVEESDTVVPMIWMGICLGVSPATVAVIVTVWLALSAVPDRKVIRPKR